MVRKLISRKNRKQRRSIKKNGGSGSVAININRTFSIYGEGLDHDQIDEQGHHYTLITGLTEQHLTSQLYQAVRLRRPHSDGEAAYREYMAWPFVLRAENESGRLIEQDMFSRLTRNDVPDVLYIVNLAMPEQ
jgi:hypothetical protein